MLLCTDACISHISATEHLPPGMRQLIAGATVLPAEQCHLRVLALEMLKSSFVQRDSAECQGWSLSCFMKLWRKGVHMSSIHQRNRSCSSNEYLDLCSSVALSTCQASETVALEFCMFVISIEMEREMDGKAKAHGMQLIQQILGQSDRVSSSKLTLHLLPAST